MSEEQATTEAQAAAPVKGHIKQMGILDLRSAKAPEDLAGITQIEQVGVVLIPEHLTTALANIPMKEVGSIAAIPQGDNVQLQLGQVRLSGEALAAGDSETILILVGQTFITSPVKQVGYKSVRVMGQLFAPRGSEAALSAKVSVEGQNFFLPEGARLFMGEDTLNKQFLELLPQPTPLIVMGQLTFTDDIPVELLQSKVPEIVLMGQICAPQALIPLLQVITVEKMGTISTCEGENGEKAEK
ncbi:MAG TPA: hypothetical protein VFB21_18140 [Chthonomonadaceae bacterium]|nr:hypothetical protein [Chthonomonadaceae bacterium]